MNHAVAVKAFIVRDNKLLMIRRASDENHDPGKWDMPGGRLEPGEDPFLGLLREAREETGLDIEILHPLRIKYFTRDDGQVITMIVFLCKVVKGEVELSEEHDRFEWIDIKQAKELVEEKFHGEIDVYLRYFQPKDSLDLGCPKSGLSSS